MNEGSWPVYTLTVPVWLVIPRGSSESKREFNAFLFFCYRRMRHRQDLAGIASSSAPGETTGSRRRSCYDVRHLAMCGYQRWRRCRRRRRFWWRRDGIQKDAKQNKSRPRWNAATRRRKKKRRQEPRGKKQPKRRQKKHYPNVSACQRLFLMLDCNQTTRKKGPAAIIPSGFCCWPQLNDNDGRSPPVLSSHFRLVLRKRPLLERRGSRAGPGIEVSHGFEIGASRWVERERDPSTLTPDVSIV